MMPLVWLIQSSLKVPIDARNVAGAVTLLQLKQQPFRTNLQVNL
jgi:hypothetical protein